MTFGTFKVLVASLLLGDNKAPNDAMLIELTHMSLLTLANKAEPLVLMTLDMSKPSVRLGPGDYVVRVPDKPEDDNSDIDIDTVLIPALARYVAGNISKAKGGIHINAANMIVLDHNASVYDTIESMANEAICVGLPKQAEDCEAVGDTEFKSCASQSTEFCG